MKVLIIPNDSGNPAGKLADAELHFTDADGGVLDGLKLIGFAIWQRRLKNTDVERDGHNTMHHLTVTFPARQYSVNGERRSFALLRPIAEAKAQDVVRATILDAYALQTGQKT